MSDKVLKHVVYSGACVILLEAAQLCSGTVVGALLNLGEEGAARTFGFLLHLYLYEPLGEICKGCV